MGLKLGQLIGDDEELHDQLLNKFSQIFPELWPLQISTFQSCQQDI